MGENKVTLIHNDIIHTAHEVLRGVFTSKWNATLVKGETQTNKLKENPTLNNLNILNF